MDQETNAEVVKSKSDTPTLSQKVLKNKFVKPLPLNLELVCLISVWSQ